MICIVTQKRNCMINLSSVTELFVYGKDIIAKMPDTSYLDKPIRFAPIILGSYDTPKRAAEAFESLLEALSNSPSKVLYVPEN